MALGIVSDKIYNEEIERYLNGSVISKNKPGAKEGENDITPALRKLIGETYVTSGVKAAEELANGLGISNSSAKAYGSGATSTVSYGRQQTSDLGQFIAKTKGRISKRAAKLAIRSIDNITDYKLQEASAGELANVARTATAIVKEMEPPVLNGAGNGPQVQFNIYAPNIAKEDKYDVIDVVSIDE